VPSTVPTSLPSEKPTGPRNRPTENPVIVFGNGNNQPGKAEDALLLHIVPGSRDDKNAYVGSSLYAFNRLNRKDGIENYFEKEEDCLPSFRSDSHFKNRAQTLGDLVAGNTGGQVFAIGDSIMGQLIALGAPGLCCSDQNICSKVNGNSFIDTSIEMKNLRERTNDWQHIHHYWARYQHEQNNNVSVWYLAPSVTNIVQPSNDYSDEGSNIPAELAAQFIRHKTIGNKNGAKNDVY
jgi:hypothetical protein